MQPLIKQEKATKAKEAKGVLASIPLCSWYGVCVFVDTDIEEAKKSAHALCDEVHDFLCVACPKKARLPLSTPMSMSIMACDTLLH